MAKDISIIFRSNKDIKEKVNKILKRNNLNLSSLLNAYMLDTIDRDMVPINIRSKMRVYSKSKVSIPEIKKALTEIIKKNYEGRIEKAYLFGSYARGEETGDSDIDIALVAENSKFDIGDRADLNNDLQLKIGKPFDLIVRNHLRPEILENVKKEEICLYEYKR